LFYEPQALRNFVKYLEAHDPGVLFLMGDLGRFFPYSDKLNRADESAASAFPTPASQLAEAERIIGTIPKQHKILLHHGNHENHLFRETGSDLYVQMAKRLGIDYIGYQAAVLLHWPGRYTHILSTHGHRAIPFSKSFDPSIQGRLDKNADIAFRRMMTSIDGGASDIYFMGHTHLARAAVPDVVRQMVNTGSRFVEREKVINHVTHPVWCYNTGSCTKSFPPGTSTYADEAMYGPSDMAFIHIDLDPHTKKPLRLQNPIKELT
jgi:predicted phosphodiesterase